MKVTNSACSRDSKSSSRLQRTALSLSICAVYNIHRPLRGVLDKRLSGERRVAPAAELTLLSSGWLMRVALLMMEEDKVVDEEHDEERKEGI